MNKRVRILLFAIVLAFLAGIAGSIFILRAPHGQTVQIVQDGSVLYTIDLSKESNQTIQVEYEGRTNVIQIQDGKIRMLEAECPDHTCVQMGWLDSAVPIVCLPNHLVIQFKEGNNGLDGII